MKLVKAILKPEKIFAVKDILTENGYHGIMTKDGHGYGEQVKIIKEQVRGRVFEQRIDSIIRVELELVVSNGKVDDVVKIIRDVAKTEQGGEGRIYVMDVEKSIHIHDGGDHLGGAEEKGLRDV
ncbi:MAG: P-II family nitrogen regulator [Candidatus Anammoxibacter sp.]